MVADDRAGQGGKAGRPVGRLLHLRPTATTANPHERRSSRRTSYPQSEARVYGAALRAPTLGHERARPPGRPLVIVAVVRLLAVEHVGPLRVALGRSASWRATADSSRKNREPSRNFLDVAAGASARDRRLSVVTGRDRRRVAAHRFLIGDPRFRPVLDAFNWSLVGRCRDCMPVTPGGQLMSCRADRAIPTTPSAPAQAIKVIAPAPGETR
jgi:hypothetical protein